MDNNEINNVVDNVINNAAGKAIYDEQRPYEKCMEKGVSSLSDAELLAIIIRTGRNGSDSVQLSKEVLNYSKDAPGILGLMHLTLPELMTIKGIGRVKAIQLQCVGELSKRISKANASQRLNFNSPSAIAQFYMEEMRHESKEVLVLVMLDTKCRMISDKVLSIGTVNASLVTPREVFLEAMKFNAVSIIILHNHPSGDPSPSNNDLVVTEKLKEAGELIGIRLTDHIIIGDNRYISLKEKGIL